MKDQNQTKLDQINCASFPWSGTLMHEENESYRERKPAIKELMRPGKQHKKSRQKSAYSVGEGDPLSNLPVSARRRNAAGTSPGN